MHTLPSTTTVCHLTPTSSPTSFSPLASPLPCPPTHHGLIVAVNSWTTLAEAPIPLSFVTYDMVLLLPYLLLLSSVAVGIASSSPIAEPPQIPTADQQNGRPNASVSIRLFASLERLSRLVDITYCVGTTGLTRPFDCASRCRDFPTLGLVTTWNTGALMSDSCGYIAVDHAVGNPSGGGLRDERSGYGTRHGAIIVAFRGTYSLTNTIVDLSTVPQEYVPYPSPDEGGDEPPPGPGQECANCTVHMGFLASWRNARDDVLPTLKLLRAQNPDLPIHLVGHSLGGAVAALAALEMKVILGWNNIIVTTFGEPRVGNAGFVRFLDDVFDLKSNTTDVEERRYRRLTHANDPVSLLPLAEWGYRSHAGEIFISKPELSPSLEDVWTCVGDYDQACIAGSEGEMQNIVGRFLMSVETDKQGSSWFRPLWGIPSRLKLWQILFAHRDYFWRLGLCLPGGDPIDSGRNRYPDIRPGDEL
jgi:hypothetical protein